MTELPTGAVTFVFTDIEGSTRLAKDLRERWGDALAEHQRLLREAFARHGGHEVDTQGDSFFFAFGSARDAVAAAAEAQRAIEGHEWPEGVRLRVRMGVHTGQASPSNGRYVGVGVHRASRICAAAHGGQVLVSQTTQDLLEDEDVAFRDLGEQRLKDLDRPIRLHQLVAPGLETRFAPPRTERKHSRLPVIVAGAVIAAAAAVALVLVFTGGSAGPVTVPPNSVAVIDPDTNEVVAAIPVGESPGPMAVGEESVWVFNRNEATISKIDLAGRNVEAVSGATLEQGVGHHLAVAEGALWAGDPLKLRRMDPDALTPVATIRHRPGDVWTAIAAGLGSLWLVDNVPRLARVDPGRNAIDRVVALQPGRPDFGSGSATVAVGEGVVWLAHAGRDDLAAVWRYEPDTGRTTRLEIGGEPAWIAVGEGAVWVTDSTGNAVLRINEAATTVEKRILVGPEPTGIAVGVGAVWVANSGDGTVTRIDPDTDRVVTTVDVGNRPQGVVVAEGAVWVTVREG